MTKSDTVSIDSPTTETAVQADDIANFDVIGASEKGARMPLRNPVTDAILMIGQDEQYIDVLGKDSATYRETMNQINSRTLTRAARTRQIGAALRARQNEQDSLELLSKLCTGWNIFVGGESPKFSEGACRQVLKQYPWIFEQVDEFIGNRGNFL